jgi:hypothetical protein
MKVRMSHKDFRFRMAVSDLRSWADSGSCTMMMELPDEKKLEFTLLSSKTTSVVMDCANPNVFAFHWPLEEVNEWMQNDQIIGMYATLTVANGHSLSIAVEKDFACNPSDQESHPDRYFARPNQEKPC